VGEELTALPHAPLLVLEEGKGKGKDPSKFVNKLMHFIVPDFRTDRDKLL